MNSEPGESTKEQTAPTQPPSPPAAINPEPPKPTIVDIKTEVINIEAKQATINATQASRQQQDPEKRLEDRIKKSDRLMILLTGVIALVGFLTWVEIHNGGITTAAQTDRIIEADDSLASATEASNRNSESALRHNLAESEKVLNASIMASRNDQRAWLGIKEITLENALIVGEPIRISVVTLNTGKSPALDASLVDLRVGPLEAASQRDLLVHYNTREVVAPNNTDTFFAAAHYSDDSIRALQAGTIRAYIKGRIGYRDIFGAAHSTRFCAYWPTGETGANAAHFFNCTTGNSMD